jgi:hypothetical protein
MKKIQKKFKKARTCEGCRASEGRNECSIGFQCRNWKPLDVCPKPKTYHELINAPRKWEENINQ